MEVFGFEIKKVMYYRKYKTKNQMIGSKIYWAVFLFLVFVSINIFGMETVDLIDYGILGLVSFVFTKIILISSGVWKY